LRERNETATGILLYIFCPISLAAFIFLKAHGKK